MSETDNTQTSAEASAPARAPERFETGFIICQRYRIVTAIGRGGMGEVYRATDLLLGHDVALKFLPPGLSRDAQAVERFRNEVRIARQVTHPNVCRVHDLGEYNGQPFLSMELIAGEDLASLLRRIGRLPEDKAYAIAGQIAAGLAAAHAKGLIHRDLKPANVMVDAEGNAVVTDFGLAATVDQARDVRSGTPAYQAPEQRSGESVSARSDIYSLGLIIAEMLTGTRPDGGPISNRSMPAEVVELLERCLAREPEKRPGSALSIARALPGSDPLAAALAAGRTPSPEAVQQAQDMPVLKPAVAIALLAVTIASMAVMAWVMTNHPLRALHISESPEVLRYKARSIATTFQPGIPLQYEAWGIDRDLGYETYLSRHPARSAVLRDGIPAERFWYRAGQAPVAEMAHGPGFKLTEWRPSALPPASVLVVVDGSGNLLRFEAAPANGGPGGRLDWGTALNASSWRGRELVPKDVTAIPRVASDQRAAWDTVLPSGEKVRIEAAAYQGRLTLFRPAGQWARDPAPLSFSMGMFWVECVALLIALWQVRAGRADVRGAMRIGVIAAVLDYASVVLSATDPWHWTPDSNPFGWTAGAVFTGLLVTICYLAMEPLLRRYWPRILVGWTRLSRGRYRDTFVASNVLAGVASASIILLGIVVYDRSGQSPTGAWPLPPIRYSDVLAALADAPLSGLIWAVLFSFVLFLCRVATRRRVAAMIVAVATVSAVVWFSLGPQRTLFSAVFYTFIISVMTVILDRFGYLAALAFLFTAGVVDPATRCFEFSWSVPYAIPLAATIIGLAGFATHRIVSDAGFWRRAAGSSLRG